MSVGCGNGWALSELLKIAVVDDKAHDSALVLSSATRPACRPLKMNTMTTSNNQVERYEAGRKVGLFTRQFPLVSFVDTLNVHDTTVAWRFRCRATMLHTRRLSLFCLL